MIFSKISGSSADDSNYPFYSMPDFLKNMVQPFNAVLNISKCNSKDRLDFIKDQFEELLPKLGYIPRASEDEFSADDIQGESKSLVYKIDNEANESSVFYLNFTKFEYNQENDGNIIMELIVLSDSGEFNRPWLKLLETLCTYEQTKAYVKNYVKPKSTEPLFTI